MKIKGSVQITLLFDDLEVEDDGVRELVDQLFEYVENEKLPSGVIDLIDRSSVEVKNAHEFV